MILKSKSRHNHLYWIFAVINYVRGHIDECNLLGNSG
jgi:hypothetical protein